MANRVDIGEAVALQMQQIIQSDEHKRIFFKGASEKCCSCSSCGKDCPCTKCTKECKACVEDKGHVHDSSCAHDKKASAIDEMIDLLSKISAIQDELGLTKSSLVTMQALATMVAELRKTAQQDVNNVEWSELIEPIKEDTELRRDFRQTAEEFPDIIDLLKQRVQESHHGEQSLPRDIFGPDLEVSADPVSFPPDSGPDIVVKPDSDEMPTWHPEAEVSPTELPPESQVIQEPIPAPGKIEGFVPQLTDKDLKSEERYTPTIAPQKSAFDKLNELLKRAGGDEGADFEDEDDAELAALFGLDDVGEASDLDQELEYGNFLAKPDEDGGPGFTYEGPGETYPNVSYKSNPEKRPFTRWNIVDEEERYRDPNDVVRVGPGEWKRFDELTPEERLEQEMGAGLHDQLPIDPDELSDEEVFPELWDESGDNEEQMMDQISRGVSHDPSDDNWDPKTSRFWS